MFDKMKQFMDMQKKIQEIKRQLDETTFEITSYDGLVRVTMSGSQELKGINIQANLQEIDKNSLERALQDAYNRAIQRSRDIAAQKMKDITGLNLPGMM